MRRAVKMFSFFVIVSMKLQKYYGRMERPLAFTHSNPKAMTVPSKPHVQFHIGYFIFLFTYR